MMTMRGNAKTGRELQVSQLEPQMLVLLTKPGRPSTFALVEQVTPEQVFFVHDVTGSVFEADRAGPDLESITDADNSELHMFEFLGERDEEEA